MLEVSYQFEESKQWHIDGRQGQGGGETTTLPTSITNNT